MSSGQVVVPVLQLSLAWCASAQPHLTAPLQGKPVTVSYCDLDLAVPLAQVRLMPDP